MYGKGIPVELFQILKDDAVKALHSICQQIWKTQQWPQDWKRSVFIPVPKKGNAKECSKVCEVAQSCRSLCNAMDCSHYFFTYSFCPFLSLPLLRFPQCVFWSACYPAGPLGPVYFFFFFKHFEHIQVSFKVFIKLV